MDDQEKPEPEAKQRDLSFLWPLIDRVRAVAAICGIGSCGVPRPSLGG